MATKFTFLGLRLKKHRKLMGYSIREAAKEVHVSPSRLSQWERGLRKPSIENLVKLAVLYRILVDEICFDLRKETIKKFEKKNLKQEKVESTIHKAKPT